MKKLIIFIAGGLMAFCSNSILAQSSFMTLKNPAQVQMSQIDANRYQNLSDAAYAMETYVVSTQDIREAAANDTLNFTLPGSTSSITVIAQQVREDDQSGFTWSGELSDRSGYFWYNEYQGLKSGYLMAPAGYYELIPLDSNYQFWVKRNPLNTADGCGMESIETPPDMTFNACEYVPDYNTCPALITVLILADEYAQADIAGLWGGLPVDMRFVPA